MLGAVRSLVLLLSHTTILCSPDVSRQDREDDIQPDSAELAGMAELFDTLDSDDDQDFEQQEMGVMMAELGLESERGWDWKSALRECTVQPSRALPFARLPADIRRADWG